MSTTRIVCTVQEPITQPTTHAHIVSVGTGSDPDRAPRLTLAQVIVAIKKGDIFYTVGETSGKIALVKVVGCDKCGNEIIRSAADAVTDNNLDNLRRCR